MKIFTLVAHRANILNLKNSRLSSNEKLLQHQAVGSGFSVYLESGIEILYNGLIIVSDDVMFVFILRDFAFNRLLN